MVIPRLPRLRCRTSASSITTRIKTLIFQKLEYQNTECTSASSITTRIKTKVHVTIVALLALYKCIIHYNKD